ncbi:hypothetical protein [Cellulomonas sp. NPDC089187]|uniref:hypothetical protein n=1 Tax=Cellulomonas sp. NPDC089187 TaxID=3154970 RepID=UPI0034364B01
MRIALRVLGVLLAGLVSIRLIANVVTPAQRIYVIVGVPLVLIIAAVLVVVLAGRPRMLASRVARLRPGAVVIAAVTVIETRADARMSGAVERRWDELGGSPVALAALPDRIEVWAAGEDRPRWAITRRVEFPPTAVLATMPGAGTVNVQPTPALLCTDGVSRVTVLPVYSSVGATSPQRAQVSVHRALAELGAPPSNM